MIEFIAFFNIAWKTDKASWLTLDHLLESRDVFGHRHIDTRVGRVDLIPDGLYALGSGKGISLGLEDEGTACDQRGNQIFQWGYCGVSVVEGYKDVFKWLQVVLTPFFSLFHLICRIQIGFHHFKAKLWLFFALVEALAGGFMNGFCEKFFLVPQVICECLDVIFALTLAQQLPLRSGLF